MGNFPVMSISDRIDQRLEVVGLSMRAASIEAGLGESWIRDLRRNEGQSPRADALEKLAPVLKTNIQWLMTGTGDPDQASDPSTAELISIMPKLDAKRRGELTQFAKYLAEQAKRETGE